MRETPEPIDLQAAEIAEAWLSQLEQAVAAADAGAIGDLFIADSYWRDALALSWCFETQVGSADIAARLCHLAPEAGLNGLATDYSLLAPHRVRRMDQQVVEAFFHFETRVGRGAGVLRLAPDPADDARWRAWTIATTLEELKGFEEALGSRRPTGQANSRDFRGPNWLDKRQAAQSYTDHDPAVLVVGGGQAGLAAAARLTQLGVDTLIIDKHERIGDNWRKRYHALTLHNQVQVNHLPYMPFPANWPSYIPKDKLANWFESYVDAMELNFWTQTELVSASYDEGEGRWTAVLRDKSGKSVSMQPAHIVMATGVSGIANMPHIPTLDQFEGEVLHSSAYRDGEDWAGKRAIVVGTGNSAHDISQDLYSSGADVTMLQRSPTLVVSIEPSAQIPYALYSEGPSLEACDLLTVATPLPLARQAHKGFTAAARETDAELLQSLERVGFKLDFGEDGTGWQFKYLTRGGGYYFNVGCSDLVAAGQVKLKPYDQIEYFTKTGAHLTDGGDLSADLIVLATGYQPQEVLVERLFGKDVCDKVGPIWGFGDGLELRNMYCRTGQPGLWFIAGSLAQCRINSKYLALQIKACEEGIISSGLDDRAHA
ncbi:MAG: flavin-containing monooxygenase [Burkholderiaceae bacterium]